MSWVVNKKYCKMVFKITREQSHLAWNLAVTAALNFFLLPASFNFSFVTRFLSKLKSLTL